VRAGPHRMKRRRRAPAVAELCVERDLLAVTDEVYEHLVFDGAHIPIASSPGMRERTVTGRRQLGRQDLLLHRLEDRPGQASLT